MKYSLFFSILLLISSFCAKPTISQGTAKDQYRQMGGVVGLTEICFDRKVLEAELFKQIGSVFYSSPEMGRTMFELLYVYFESYEKAKSDQVIWNGTQQSYNKEAFDCSDENKKLIKNFEEQLIKELNRRQ